MNTPLVTIEQHEHFYVVIFHQLTNEAIDAWLQQVEQLHQSFEPQDRVSYKLLTPYGQPVSMAYVVKAANESIRRNPHRPITRTAVMYYPKDAGLLSFLDMFLRWLTLNPRDQIRFFSYDDEDEANRWLRWLE